MKDYQKAFIDFCLQENVLQFGEFTLKSGRINPYFFNAGLFNTGSALSRLGQFYAAAICDAGVKFDVVFGPAYKGITIAASTAIALADQHNMDKPFCFNRKEAKDHGEGGNLVGAPLKGDVLIIDDVITAGTAIRECLNIINNHKAQCTGVTVALDRQERGQGDRSAIQEIEADGMQVVSIITLEHLLEYMKSDATIRDAILKYREEYGISLK